jgi:glutathione S-transferase
MKVKLYGIPGSPPVMSAQLMLEYKGIPYKRRDLFPVVHRPIIRRVLRFPGNRVPAMKIDGRRVQGSRDIPRELDRLQPDPLLVPTDPDKRAAVEEAEIWGDPFQQIPRTIVWWALRNQPSAKAGLLEHARLGVPLPPRVLAKTSRPIVWQAGRLNDSSDEGVRKKIDEIPAALDRIDGWIADGVLNGEQLNAADFEIAPTVRLLMAFADFEPVIDARPAGAFARRVVPKAPGRIEPVFPAEWLQALAPASAV